MSIDTFGANYQERARSCSKGGITSIIRKSTRTLRVAPGAPLVQRSARGDRSPPGQMSGILMEPVDVDRRGIEMDSGVILQAQHELALRAPPETSQVLRDPPGETAARSWVPAGCCGAPDLRQLGKRVRLTGVSLDQVDEPCSLAPPAKHDLRRRDSDGQPTHRFPDHEHHHRAGIAGACRGCVHRPPRRQRTLTRVAVCASRARRAMVLASADHATPTGQRSPRRPRQPPRSGRRARLDHHRWSG